ncbi:protein phosphatase 2C and cyclic nucleotide-binding/kinase domain-containing protein-like isoform X1 [Zingiber officinale]|uniref:protein phosphatase 2C and cyclic nucleotide-binding/kinase domain-containing protein-like isoform X1 n=1 Tax=Zingiber officinale TaxID=94328 RepID=UPI001C4B07BE|nr:protein phosphatase 2C and cyclic nucleotide-binding/kinase domain-containing protein-like isoform X1 [Zingiber officinale]XP_042461507.1 protein phosphatase 2C and cyclic nucleotide-binding/kinase domain-containing protein-like isoform X1 [Zingiber officinale]XP_042461508.1 protein phosphatase 2C and cyclic nucleotide-binding/kinase domain-containing protein-like isoform X1 [Zingiber officinale]XP_042461509.1 protein phosphatase 2C and cyclic nucleotide-binding/kinase domain-containing prote
MGCFYSRGCLGQVPHSPTTSYSKGNRIKGVETGDTSSDSDAESEDQLNQLSITRDSDVGINRLSRVSSQFLPPEGSRKVRVPGGNFELRYSYLSQRGYYPEALDKANQDSFCIHTPFGTNLDDHFFGVFDGHGENGAQCSQFVKRKLCENLLRSNKFQTDAFKAIHAAFLATNSQLHADSLDDSMSGTTAITILVRGRTIYVANAGDSRAVIAEKRGKDIVAVDLSLDQTPFRNDELERVKNCGARVLTLDQIEGLKNPDVQCWGTEEGDDGDPPRLWVQNAMYPGTAFTRSIGDSVAESIGVVAAPEIFVMELTPLHPFFVIASDGVFEFLSSQTVVDMVAKFKDPRDACAAIVAESYRLWLQFETRTDDITIIVVHISGIPNAMSPKTGADMPLNPSEHVQDIGSESPLTLNWNARTHRAKQDPSRTRLKAIESYLENGYAWAPPSPSNRKTWEEEAHIEQALHDHFLFRKLTDSQRHVLLDCMRRVDVKPGDVVVQQGGEGDCFYVVGTGEFEVVAIQEEEGKEVTKVLHRYTAEKLSSFGELALMYNKPLQASVHAVTAGTLWCLKREDFRGILMSEFSNLSSLKLLRSVDLFSKLTILQLSHIAEALIEVSFSDGQQIVDKNQHLSSLYLIQKGKVRLTYRPELLSPNACSLLSTLFDQGCHFQENGEHVVEISEGSHFGQWTLLDEHINSLTAVSVGKVVCSVFTKENFDLIVAPLTKTQNNHRKSKDFQDSMKEVEPNSASGAHNIQFSDLEWKMSIYSTDCCEIGLVILNSSDTMRSLKMFSTRKIKDLGKEECVLKERELLKSLSLLTFVPKVLCTCADDSHVGILLDCCLACPLASVINTPLDEQSAQYFAASVIVALEELHMKSILYRGVSPDVLMLDQSGRLQLVDFRFSKKLDGERTFTICGNADYLAPEVILGKGHKFAADWWALGVLIYYMLQAEMPFGSWRESELETFAKIAKGQLTLPQSFSIEVVDLITKLLEVDEAARLGSDGPTSIKSHSWFNDIDWKLIADGTFPVPDEVITRANSYIETHAEAATFPVSSPHDLADLNTPEWLEGW